MVDRDLSNIEDTSLESSATIAEGKLGYYLPLISCRMIGIARTLVGDHYKVELRSRELCPTTCAVS
jgi:hypothetical protein